MTIREPKRSGTCRLASQGPEFLPHVGEPVVPVLGVLELTDPVNLGGEHQRCENNGDPQVHKVLVQGIPYCSDHPECREEVHRQLDNGLQTVPRQGSVDRREVPGLPVPGRDDPEDHQEELNKKQHVTLQSVVSFGHPEVVLRRKSRPRFPLSSHPCGPW